MRRIIAVSMILLTILSTFMLFKQARSIHTISGSFVLDLDKLYIVLDADHGNIKELRYKEWDYADLTPVDELDSLRPFSAVASPIDNAYILGGTASTTSEIVSETSETIIIECKNEKASIVYSFYRNQQFFDAQVIGNDTWQYVLRYRSVPEKYATDGETGDWTEKQVIVCNPWIGLKFDNLVVAASWDRTSENGNHVTLDDSEAVPLPPGETAKGVDIGDLWMNGSLIPQRFSFRFRLGVYFAGNPWYEPAKKQFEQSRNLAENPSFEQQLDHWSISDGTAAYTTDTTDLRSGSYSGRGIELNTGSLGRLYQDMTDEVGTGGRYKIGGWIKTQEAVGQIVIALDYVASNGWTPADGYVMEIGHVTGTTDWTYYESDVFTLPPMPNDASRIWFLFDFNNGNGTAYWDDVLLAEVEAPCTLSDFDQRFSINNISVVNPSDSTPKPLDCGAASVSDWLASAFVTTELQYYTEGLDTNNNFVDQTSGRPLGFAGMGIVTFGGPLVNPVVKYAESNGTTSANRAPIRFYDGGDTFFFQHWDGSSIAGASLPASVIDHDHDMFVIETYGDGYGRYMMVCYGFGWKGTYAAGKYFHTTIYPNLGLYDVSWTIVKWQDTNNDGFVNAPYDGDAYTVVASGH